MLQLSDIDYDITSCDTTPECFIINLDVLTSTVAFQKQVELCKKVSFNPFKEIIYIPKYNKEYIPHLWWSISELKYIHKEVKQEIFNIMQNSLINIDVKGALGILCEYND
jgi:hypothetical protein